MRTILLTQLTPLTYSMLRFIITSKPLTIKYGNPCIFTWSKNQKP